MNHRPRKRFGQHFLQDPAAFATPVQTTFSHRRKTLHDALRGLANAEAIVPAGIDPALRPDELGVADYGRLSKLLSLVARNP